MATTREIVERDFREKIRLERVFTPEVKSIFSRTLANFKTSVAATGAPPSITPAPWVGALQKHYARTQKAFKGSVTRQQKTLSPIWYLTKQDEVTDETISRFNLALLLWADESSELSASQITETTEKNMLQAISQARSVIIEQELPSDNRTLAATATAILKRKFSGRVQGITSSETQGAAESTKLMEAQTLSGVLPFVLQPVGPVEVTDSTKRWITVGDNKVRDIHQRVNGQIRNIQHPFDVNGEMLRSPGDRSLGASAGNIINCLHPDSKIWFASPVGLTRRWYEGSLVTIKTKGGKELTVTPNHPILSGSGWVDACRLNEGSSIVCTSPEEGSRLGALDIQDVMPSVEEIYNSFSAIGAVVRVPRVEVNFHGEVPNHDIDVIEASGTLGYTIKSKIGDPLKKFSLPHADLLLGLELAKGLLDLKCVRLLSPFGVLVRSLDLISPDLKAHLRPLKRFGLALASGLDPRIFQNLCDRASAYRKMLMDTIDRVTGLVQRYDCLDFGGMFFHERGSASSGSISNDRLQSDVGGSKGNTEAIGDLLDGGTFEIHLDHVVSVHIAPYAGYVYNLEDEKSYYICNGIANHNCRCSSVFRVA